jgi:hypothetical protein
LTGRTMKRIFVVTLALILFEGISLAQVAPPQSSSGIAPGTLISAELSKPVDVKKARVGDKVEARSVVDVLSNGQVLVPKGSKIIGHVSGDKPRTKDSQDSTVGIVFDTLSIKGRELTIQATIQAIGPALLVPNYSTRTGFPIAGKNGPTATGGWGEASDKPGSSLDPSSHGIVGLEGLSLGRSGPASVVSSSGENVHLESGTQLILRIEESL